MKKESSSSQPKLGALAELVRNARLVWRLFLDRKVSPLLKAIIPATLVYLVMPIDLIPDALLGLGQVDDLALIVLGVRLFLQLVPADIVAEHLRDLSGRDRDAVDASYHVVNEDEAPNQATRQLPPEDKRS